MIDELVQAVLSHEGSAALVTSGAEGPHLVATWNSYIAVLDEKTISFPAGGMRETEANVRAGSKMQLIIGTREVKTGRSSGTGFRLTGFAEFQSETPVHATLRERFPWCRAAVVVRLTSVEKVLG